MKPTTDLRQLRDLARNLNDADLRRLQRVLDQEAESRRLARTTAFVHKQWDALTK